VRISPEEDVQSAVSEWELCERQEKGGERWRGPSGLRQRLRNTDLSIPLLHLNMCWRDNY